MSIGARSQSARTYLEKYVDDFQGCNYKKHIHIVYFNIIVISVLRYCL